MYKRLEESARGPLSIRKRSENDKIANSQNFFAKILQIGPWVSRID